MTEMSAEELNIRLREAFLTSTRLNRRWQKADKRMPQRPQPPAAGTTAAAA